ncbi:hypothetical protein EN781_00290 [Mesorhizobium sp. M4A.F.Ca.ET.090.04.2.1]|uniref:hypothetical protein n=1 Tax=Mesorhizobium sp. M4A.F.Ca.ET.090.04.2.1 TaxID=2496663 RepID=UPI000FCB3001|nr:hypothetical protein [Mesorhizobium sp. M4A.F.Ca.ET.090.04.2.1]RVC47610.1 hypothetical protein EN781_00290 [Mesorhizobium sp. M4A.F.Ca.ET.090.04.2.1]
MGAISRKFHRDLIGEAKEIVEAAGGTCRLERGRGPHGKLVISLSGKTRTTAVSCSPRCSDNSIYMKLADVRRILREMMR